MSRPLRTFIAIPVAGSQPLRKLLDRLHQCGPEVRVVKADSLHVTLAFLGATPVDQLVDISNAIEAVSRSFQSSTLELRAVGTFPNSQRPSVIWAGLQPAELLKRLAEDLAGRLERLGFPRERREFQPHLTLARVNAKPTPALREVLDEFATTSLGACPMEEIVYYQSELTVGVPQYTELSKHVVGG